MDMQTGMIVNLPFEGGVLDQPGQFIDAMRAAWRVWYLHKVKLPNNKEFTEDDREFMEWVTSG